MQADIKFYPETGPYDTVRESVDLILALSSDPMGPGPRSLKDLSREEMLRAYKWCKAKGFVVPDIRGEPYPVYGQDLREYYAKAKYWLQGMHGLLTEMAWCKYANVLMYPQDRETGYFDPGDKGISWELLWAKYDAAVSRWADELPSRPRGFRDAGKFKMPYLKDGCYNNMDEWDPHDSLLSIMRPVFVFVSSKPFPWVFTEVFDELMRTLDLRPWLKKSQYPELLQYVKDKTPLPSHGIVMEYVMELACLLFETEYMEMQLTLTECNCDECAKMEMGIKKARV